MGNVHFDFIFDKHDEYWSILQSRREPENGHSNAVNIHGSNRPYKAMLAPIVVDTTAHPPSNILRHVAGHLPAF